MLPGAIHTCSIGKRMQADKVTALFRQCTAAGPISGSGSEAGYLPCPTRSPMFRSALPRVKRSRRSDRSTPPTRSIRTKKALNLERNSSPYNFQLAFYPDKEGPEFGA